MATMYDAVTPANIPAYAEVVAGYIDGRYAWRPGDWARFPKAAKVRVAVFASTLDGDVLDVEQGDATPQQAPGWVASRRRAGHPGPVVYCSRVSAWPAVRAEFQRQGVPEPLYWIADYTGSAHLVPGSVATQWTDAGPYDVSLTDGSWPSSPPPSPVVTTGPLLQEDNMTPHVFSNVALDDKGNGWVPLPGTDESKIVSIKAHGSFPPADGYWPIPAFGSQQRGADAVVEITGGAPHQVVEFTVFVAA